MLRASALRPLGIEARLHGDGVEAGEGRGGCGDTGGGQDIHRGVERAPGGGRGKRDEKHTQGERSGGGGCDSAQCFVGSHRGVVREAAVRSNVMGAVRWKATHWADLSAGRYLATVVDFRRSVRSRTSSERRVFRK